MKRSLGKLASRYLHSPLAYLEKLLNGRQSINKTQKWIAYMYFSGNLALKWKDSFQFFVPYYLS